MFPTLYHLLNFLNVNSIACEIVLFLIEKYSVWQNRIVAFQEYIVVLHSYNTKYGFSPYYVLLLAIPVILLLLLTFLWLKHILLLVEVKMVYTFFLLDK